ncbi:MAG: hydrolase [Alphaproteobacteria bacterium]|nr:hydrolase [Alphaproteobacteria bacterium]
MDYAERGYGDRDVGWGERPGVVVVDFQRGFTDPEFQMGGAPMIDAAVERTVNVMGAAREAGFPIAACVMGYDSPAAMPHWKIAPLREELIAGHPSVELDPRIAAAKPDLVVMKGGPSIFFNTQVAPFLIKHGVDTVVVTGCITSGCVRASVIDAFSLGFRTIVPEDCVGDHEDEPHQSNLRDVDRRYADVVDADAVLGAFERLRGRNASGEAE